MLFRSGCVSLFSMRHLIFLLFVVNCERLFFFSYPVKRSRNKRKKTVPNTEEETKVCALFSIVFKCSETDRIATMAQSTKFRINRKQTRRMLENVEILLNVSFFFGSAYSLLILVTFFFSCGCLSNSLTSVFFVLYL